MHVSHFVANGALQTALFDLEGAAPADATPLVLVHGFTGSKLDFQDQLPWFSHARRVIAYDQRGHGESSNSGPYDFYSLVNDLFGILDALEIERAHVLGHSMGGMVVMRAALAQPQRFASLVLMDTSAAPLSLFDDAVRTRLDEMVLEHGCAALLEGMHGKPQPAPVRRGIEHLGEQEHWRRIRVKLEQMDPEAFVELGALLNDHPSILSSLARLDVPTTVLVGTEDRPFLAASQALAETIPNARLVQIPEAGHSPQYENASAWREAIDTHLAGAANA